MAYLRRHPMLAAWLVTLLLVWAALQITHAQLDFWPQCAVIGAVQAAVLVLIHVCRRTTHEQRLPGYPETPERPGETRNEQR
jgi:hypothetical protein